MIDNIVNWNQHEMSMHQKTHHLKKRNHTRGVKGVTSVFVSGHHHSPDGLNRDSSHWTWNDVPQTWWENCHLFVWESCPPPPWHPPPGIPWRCDFVSVKEFFNSSNPNQDSLQSTPRKMSMDGFQVGATTQLARCAQHATPVCGLLVSSRRPV